MASFTESSQEPLRDIAAPFQEHSAAAACHGESVIVEEKSREEKFEEEFRNIKYSFGTIRITDKFDRLEYEGPTDESNWVVKGKLMVGAYPGDINDKKNEELLTKILNCGVTTFACLQEEYDNEIAEPIWRDNMGLRPYFKDVEKMISNKTNYPCLTTPVTHTNFVQLKIKDCNIVDDGVSLKFAKKLVKAIYDGEVVYLHCWGGHGRAGVVASIMLHLMFNLTAFQSMELCQTLHDMRKIDLHVCSPQTIKQRLQVTRIITRVMAEK